MSFHGILTHVEFQQLFYEVCLAQGHLFQTHILADKMLELVGRDFSQTFESGDFGVGTQFFNGFHTFLLCIAITCLLFVAHAEERGLQDYKDGLIDVLVTAPINKNTIQSEAFHFPGHTEYIEERVGEGQKALMILLKNDFRVALVTGHVPVRDIAKDITKELIMEKLAIFHRSLKEDFGIDSPRIAVFSLNPHAGDNGLIGTEENDIIIPAIKEMVAKGVQCFGPYPADGFMGSGNYTHFDGILAMYHDQGLAPFKALAMDEGVNYTAGLPIVRTSPAHGTAYDIAGQGVALEDSFRQAIYVAMDIFRNRIVEKAIHARPLRKQYYERRDDSDKLKLDTIDEED